MSRYLGVLIFILKKTVIRIGHDNAGFCLEKLIVAPQ